MIKVEEENLGIKKYFDINSLNNGTKFSFIKYNNKSSSTTDINLFLLKNIILFRYFIKFIISNLFSIYIIINVLYFEYLSFINDINDQKNEIFNINKSEQYLKLKMINQFNKYIKICKKGILIKKKRFSLSNHPKISVIIPIYNGGKYLYYSLRSIQNQKMKNIEIILIDDFSNDNSLNIIKFYMKEDPRIRLIKNKKNRKILYSKSIGALNSNGKYIIELDQDDMFIRDDCLDILIGEAEANNLELVHIRDYSKKGFHFSYKTKVNEIKYHLIYPQETNYKSKPNLKNKIFTDNNVYLLWGLLIKSELYKKTIYKIWPIILNYQLIFHEDYTISFFLVISANRYKYINKFGILLFFTLTSTFTFFFFLIFTFLFIIIINSISNNFF